VEETFSGNYVVVFDPLDGSSNIDAGISTGSIFGIYDPNDECSLEVSRLLSTGNLYPWYKYTHTIHTNIHTLRSPDGMRRSNLWHQIFATRNPLECSSLGFRIP